MTFYPTNDYDSVWNGDFWGGWEDPIAYPSYYFEWLHNDSMDLNLEFWPVQLVRPGFDGHTDYILTDADASVYPELEGESKIDYGGHIGTYPETSIWMPKYWSDDHPSHMVPDIYANGDAQTLMVDGVSLWDLLIEASCGGSTNWTAMYQRHAEILTGVYEWDSPTCTRPVIWGSVDDYAMSEYAYHLKNNLGMDVDFVTTGSESGLMDVVADMYARRVPFLADMYSIDDNFGRLEASGELQLFEKLKFDRNTDQSFSEPCYLDQECEWPIEPIMKAANSRLKYVFPEAHEFFTGFSMTARDVNTIVSYYHERKAAQTTESHTEVWLQAACDFLKNDDSWNNSLWMVDVVRYDCLEGCYSGDCDYMTGECVCDEGWSGDSCMNNTRGPTVDPTWEPTTFTNTTESMFADWDEDVNDILQESALRG